MVTLDQSYDRCADLIKREDGTTMSLMLKALSKEKGRQLQSLWAFNRIVDRVVTTPGDVDDRVSRLETLRVTILDGMETGDCDHEILKATVHTATELGIAASLFTEYLDGQQTDIRTDEYETWEQLHMQMDQTSGSSGEIVLPVFEVSGDEANACAREMGIAARYTTRLREVGKDLDRGKIYMARDELDSYGTDVRPRRVDKNWRRFMDAQITKVDGMNGRVEEGLDHMPGGYRTVVEAGHRLSVALLGTIRKADYDVFSESPDLSGWQKTKVLTGSSLGRFSPFKR